MDQFKYQEGLNEVVTNKVHRMIDNHQPVVMQTVERLLRECSNTDKSLRIVEYS